MTPTFMNAFCEAFAHAQNKPRGCTPPLVEWIDIDQLSCVQIKGMWEMGCDTSMYLPA